MKLKDEEEEDETEQPAAETAPDLQQVNPWSGINIFSVSRMFCLKLSAGLRQGVHKRFLIL